MDDLKRHGDAEEPAVVLTNLDSLPAVLTASEVAAVLRIPRSTVYYLAARGKIPCVKLGRTWRMPKTALVQFLGGGKPEPAPKPAKPKMRRFRLAKD